VSDVVADAWTDVRRWARHHRTLHRLAGCAAVAGAALRRTAAAVGPWGHWVVGNGSRPKFGRGAVGVAWAAGGLVVLVLAGVSLGIIGPQTGQDTASPAGNSVTTSTVAPAASEASTSSGDLRGPPGNHDAIAAKPGTPGITTAPTTAPATAPTTTTVAPATGRSATPTTTTKRHRRSHGDQRAHPARTGHRHHPSTPTTTA